MTLVTKDLYVAPLNTAVLDLREISTFWTYLKLEWTRLEADSRVKQP